MAAQHHAFRATAVDKPPKGSAQHTSAEWESRKDEIRRLYMDEQKTLRDVVREMSRRGFNAKERQYKPRLKRWGYLKYAPRGSDMVLARKRRSGHDESAMADSDKAVLMANDQFQKTATAYRVGPSFQQSLIARVRNLVRRHYSLDPSHYQGTRPFLAHVGSGTRQAVDDLVQASAFYRENSFCRNTTQSLQAYNFAMQAFNAIDNFLDDANFYALLYLFICIYRLQESRLLPIFLKSLCRQAQERAQSEPGKRQLADVIQKLYTFYESSGISELGLVMNQAMNAILEAPGETISSRQDYSMVWLRCDHSSRDNVQQTMRVLEETTALAMSVANPGQRSPETDHAFARLLYLQLQLTRQIYGDGCEATLSTAEMVNCALDAVVGAPYDTLGKIRALCHRTMASCHHGLSVTDSSASHLHHYMARIHLGKAVEFDEAAVGLTQKLTIDDMMRLEMWNMEAGCWEEAEAARAKWVAASCMGASTL